ncbi:Fur family transcriptional regulator [Flammeovirga sp. EKP202]|uniref:Fur family transcriptional regulator n=1 Tax=Flammeovirga sp. EKP202 TaxID=2770592 RepID=UPI00165F304C|nr:Fur family transcriptional regulator [Flammeovirga sp. EKP202]MBD0402452.1 transcriptional repressor [Flammeovirga sp. EKP202]
MKTEQKILELLSNNGIRKTNFRIELLELFYKNKHGLSHRDIKEAIECMPDKVTIYRALDTFMEKGIIHKVPDINNVSRYALTKHECAETHHNHAHFICNSCHKTFCMDDIQIPEIQNAHGFKINSIKLILEGKCSDCSECSH